MTNVSPSKPAGLLLRGLFLLTLVVVAVGFVAASRNHPENHPEVDEARLGRRVELVELIRIEQARNERLQARVEELASQIEAFEEDPPGDPQLIGELQEQIDALAVPAGITPVEGPGLVVRLTDSSLSESPSGDLNDLVIHEEDLQAVINALWAGGAEAIAVNGQRILATTAIRCVGNTLLLHGSVYSPPYVIAAIGDELSMHASLDRDPAVERFSQAVSDFQLGYSVRSVDELQLPGFEGVSAMSVARPVEATS